MKTETAIGAAMRAKGLHARDVRLNIAIAEFQNNGGTFDRLMELARAAYGMPGEGLRRDADNGRIQCAPARQPDDADGGRGPRADNGHTCAATAASPNGDGGGRSLRADNGQARLAPASPTYCAGEGQAGGALQRTVALPVREPNATQIAATIATKKEVAKSVFDRYTTRTGQAWGSVCYRHLDSFYDDGDTAMVIKGYIGHLRDKERNKMIRELMTPSQFAAAMRKAERLRKVRMGYDNEAA